MLYSVFTILVFAFISQTDGSCTFPTDIRGTWFSAHKGDITFSSDGGTVSGYPIYMSASVNSLNFTCDQQSGYKYLLKSTEVVEAFSSYIDAYLCIELHRISAYKYYYYIGTAQSGTNNDYIYGRLNGTVVSLSEGCNRAEPYETSTYVMLVKSDAISTGMAVATCPDDMLVSYTNAIFSNYAGASSCGGTSMNACDNKLLIAYAYSGCITNEYSFSANGSFHCLFSLTSSDTTYLSLWNDDIVVDDNSTFRVTCMAFQKVGSNIYATEYPRFCEDTTQDSVTVTAPGIKRVYNTLVQTCVTRVTAVSSGGWIALIVILAIFVPGGIVVGIIIIKKHKNKINMLASYRMSNMQSRVNSPE